MRATDWAQTPLGAVDRLAAERPRARADDAHARASRCGWRWGDELALLLQRRVRGHDARRQASVGARPSARARCGRRSGATSVRGSTHVLTTGEATWDEGLLLFLERSGYPEETYHTFSYSPLHDDDGRDRGMLCVVTEETERVIGERRLARPAATSAPARGVADDRATCWRASSTRCSSDPRDLPFTLDLPVRRDDELRARGAHRRRRRRSGPPRRPRRRRTTSCGRSHEVIAPAARRPSWISVRPGSGRAGRGRRRRRARIVLPIAQQGQAAPAGVFVAGLNPYRPLDAGVSRASSVCSSAQVAAGLANAQAYEAERRRAEALAELDRAKTTFFSNVSHEFRTPLTLMLGPLDDALATPAAARSRARRSTMVHRNGLRLLKLVNTLLDFSRIEAGRVAGQLRADRPRGAHRASSRACSARRSSAPGCASWSRAAARRAGLRRSRHVGEDRPQPALERLQVHVRGRDRGVGSRATGTQVRPGGARHRHRHPGRRAAAPLRAVPPRARARAAAPTRAPASGSRSCRSWCKLHGGTIGVESELGRGTTFTVTIPLGRAHLPADRDRRAIGESRRRACGADAVVSEALRWLPDAGTGRRPVDTAPPAGASSSAARILLADDNADMRDYLRRPARRTLGGGGRPRTAPPRSRVVRERARPRRSPT